MRSQGGEVDMSQPEGSGGLVPSYSPLARGLAAKLLTLRHLPPGTPLDNSLESDRQALFQELLLLPDDVDPVRWLREEHTDYVATQVLRYGLRQLRDELYSVRGGGRPDLRELPAGIQAMWDDHARAWVGNWNQVDPFADVEVAGPDTLRAILRRVRRIRPRYAGPSGVLPAGDLPLLLDDLLRLPDDIDPIRWLGDDRGDLSATLTLQGVLAHVTPPDTAVGGEPSYVAHPGDVVSFPGRAEFTLEEVSVGPVGSTVDVLVRTFPDNIPRPAEVHYLMLLWQGLDHVRDDRGFHYLFRSGAPVQLDTQGQLFRLRADYYPAVASGATELILTAAPARLTPMGVPAGKDTPALPEVVLGDLVWRVRLP